MRAVIKSHLNGPYLEITPENDAERAWMNEFKKTEKRKKLIVHFGNGKMRVFARVGVSVNYIHNTFPLSKTRANISRPNAIYHQDLMLIDDVRFVLINRRTAYGILCRVLKDAGDDVSFLNPYGNNNRAAGTATYSPEHKAWRIYFASLGRTVYYRVVRIYKTYREFESLRKLIK